VTAKARAAIRHYLKGLKHSEAVELGRRLLTQALADLNVALKKVPEERLQSVATEFNLKSPEELFEQIGLGERLAPLVARRLLPSDADAVAVATGSTHAALAIAGTEGMVVSYARCCFPIPNDPIMAYLSSGRGVVIHREACGNLRNYRKQPDKWLSVTWQPNVDRLFNVEIRIDVANRMGVLAAIASNIATTETNIEHVAVDERDGDASTLVFDLQVRDRKHLAHVIKNLRKMPEVLRVTRMLA
jgi:guanosine-3',5'-bis(diphosphate) 3'-pyrophosphohydrolase